MHPTRWQRVRRALFGARQVMVLDPHGGGPARRFMLRPGTLILAALLLTLAAFILGYYLHGQERDSSLLPQFLQLQRDHREVREQLAEREAEVALREQELKSLRGLMEEREAENERLDRRIVTLEEILEARKRKGVQITTSDVRWVDTDTLAYTLVLVKGGNYPRRVSGSVALVAHAADGEEHPIAFDGDRTRLSYRMESHMFLRGTAPWELDWKPRKLTLVRFDHRGAEIERQEVRIKGER